MKAEDSSIFCRVIVKAFDHYDIVGGAGPWDKDFGTSRPVLFLVFFFLQARCFELIVYELIFKMFIAFSITLFITRILKGDIHYYSQHRTVRKHSNERCFTRLEAEMRNHSLIGSQQLVN